MSEEDKAEVRELALDVIADYRDRGCPEPEPIGPELLQEMMEWLVCEPVPDEYVPMLLEEMELDGADARAARSVRRTAARRLPGRRHRLRRVGLLAGIRLQGGRHPVHDRREERRRRRHLVGEHLPGCPGRRRKPLLLLQLRAERPLDRVLRRAARAAGLLPARDGQARHRPARAVGDRGHRGVLGRRHRHLDGAARATATARRRRCRRARSSPRSVSSNRPHLPDDPRAGRISPGRRSTPRSGTTPSTCAASGSR